MNKLVGYHTVNADPRHYSANSVVGSLLICKKILTYKDYEKQCKLAGCTHYNEDTFNEYLDAEKIVISLRFLRGNWKAFNIVLNDNDITFHKYMANNIEHFTIKASEYAKVMRLAEKWDAILEQPPPPAKELNSKHYHVSLTWKELQNIFNEGYNAHANKYYHAQQAFDNYMLKTHNIKLEDDV